MNTNTCLVEKMIQNEKQYQFKLWCYELSLVAVMRCLVPLLMIIKMTITMVIREVNMRFSLLDTWRTRTSDNKFLQGSKIYYY